MKFLFSQDHSFTPEKFGRVLFIEVQGKKETIKKPVGIPEEVFGNKMEKRNTELKLERKDLSKSVEKEQTLKMETAGNKIFNDIQSNIRKDLPKSQARTLTAVTYGRRIDDIAKRSQGAIDKWIKDYGRVIPSDGGMGNLKIAAVVGAVAYGNTKGGMLARLKNAAVWGAGAAAITHPAITGGLAGIMSFTGKTVLAPVIGVGIPNLIFTLIDDPRSIERALRKSARKQTSIDSTPIYQLLAKGETQRDALAKDLQTGSQNAFELRAKGLDIGDANLNNVMNDIEQYENSQRLGQPRTFPPRGITNAATFILQIAEHTLNEVELYEFRKAMWNKEASPGMIRRVLATNAEKEVLAFFEKNGMMSQLEAEMSKQSQQGVIPPAKVDLSKMFVDGTVDAGTPGFTPSNKKHGIRRFLSMGGGGMALALYAIAFLGITGLMNVKKIAQLDFWKKSIPKAAKAPFVWGAAKWENFKKLFKKSPLKELSGISKDNKWTTLEQRKVIKGLNKKDRKTVESRFNKFAKDKDDTYKNKVKGAKKLKGDQKKKALKDLKDKRKVKMEKPDFISMFEGVSDKAKKELNFK